MGNTAIELTFRDLPAYSFDAQRIPRRWRLVQNELCSRHLRRCHQQIFREGRRDRLRVVVVAHPFEKRISNPVGNTAIELAFRNLPIQNATAVLRHHVIDDVDLTRLRVDFNLDDGAAAGKSLFFDHQHLRCFHTWLHAFGKTISGSSCNGFGDITETDFEVRTTHPHLSPYNLKIGFSRFEHIGGHAQDFLSHGRRRHVRRRAGRHGKSTVRGADPVRNRSCIANGDDDVLGVTSELCGDDPGQHRAGPLSDGRSAAGHEYLPRCADTNSHRFERPSPGAFHIVTKTDTEITSICPRRRLSRPEAAPIRTVERFLLHDLILARVENDRQSTACMQLFFVRHRVRRNEVPAAYFGPVDIELLRNPVEQTLHCKRGLRMPGTPHRRCRNLVRQRDLHIHHASRHHISHRQRLGGVGRKVDAAARIRSVVVNDLTAYPKYLAVGIGRDFDFPILVTFLGSSDEMLTAILDPFHRPFQDHRGDTERHVFWIEYEFRAKPAADVRRHDADVAFIAAKHIDQGAHCRVRCLRRTPIGQKIFRRIVVRDATPTLHRMPPTAVLPQ